MPTELIWKSQQYSVDYHSKGCIVGQKWENNKEGSHCSSLIFLWSHEEF